MKKPLVALVGRPNVGKSTLFNKIVGKRISIVKDEPGVTRDRIYAGAEWLNYKFNLVDTGGLDLKNTSEVQKNIMAQAQVAIELADVIVFVVDGKEGLNSSDKDIATFLRKSKKPVVVCVNKLDNNEVENSYEFYELALGEPMVVSSVNQLGFGELLDAIVSKFPKGEIEDNEVDAVKIALVGKPNVGKSSLVNRILGEERVVVSAVAGTTRDAIDTPFKYEGKDYILIDTAGIRRKRAVEFESVEDYSVIRSLEAIQRADVVVIVFDASEPLSEQDVRIAGMVHEAQKPSVVVVNKWDAIEKDQTTTQVYEEKLNTDLSFMDYFISVYTSAKSGQRVGRLMPEILRAYENANRHVSTSIINEILQDAVRMTQPPSKNGKRVKFYFASQPSVMPPTFVFSCNDAKIIHFSYQRYLENCIRKAIDFSGTPIKLIFRSRSDE
ncbi:MAG: ribosome biogenesis GTPase Der [Clostridiales bacterium]|nr:ribosome biogenesis GTPase Der [Candidatus Apopatousia equi]